MMTAPLETQTDLEQKPEETSVDTATGAEVKPEDAAKGTEAGKSPDGGETPPAPEKVTIPADRLRELEQDTADLKDLRKDHARLKGVAGRQSKEIAAGKAAQTAEADADEDEAPEPRRTRRRPATFTPDEDGNVVYRGVEMTLAEAEMKRDDDEAMRNITARQDAEDERRQAAESAQAIREEKEATMAVQADWLDAGADAALSFLNVTDKQTAEDTRICARGLLGRGAEERRTSLEDLGAEGVRSVLTEDVVPRLKRMLGYRHREQTQDNDEYRRTHPAQTGGAPGVPADKLPSEMTEAERMRAYEAVSAKHTGGST